MAFSKQQLEAATKIITLFVSIVQWVVLRAQMQSGKTGTFLFVAAEMLRTRKVKKVIIICGNGEKALKKQLKEELSMKKSEETFLKRYQMYLVNVIGMSGYDLIDTIASMDLDNNIQIRCGADLDKKHDHLIGEVKDTLFIWEESHHAAGKTNRPNKFLKRMGISADGNPMQLEGEGKNNYVLSVSATPFAEVSDVHHEAQHKQIVDLQPGDGYRGVAYYLEKIIGFTKWEVILPDILRQYAAEGGIAKYALIRIHGDKDMDKARKIVEENGWAHKIYDAEHVATRNPLFMLSWDELKVAPLQNTIIFIRNMGRMGQVLPKQYLRFVMETAHQPNTDTALQGLLGRMCGYHEFDIDVYLSSNIVESKELDTFIKGGVPSKAAHMSKTREQVFDAFPIILRGEVEDRADPDYVEWSTDQTRALVKTSILKRTNIVCDKNGPIHCKDIQRQIANPNTHIYCRNIESKTYANVPLLFEGILAGTQDKKAVRSLAACGLNASKWEQVNAWVFNTNQFASNGFPMGTIIVQAACKITADGESPVPKTKGTEAFTSKQEDGTEVVSNGSCAVTISPATATSVSAMKSAIDELVRMSLQKRETVTVSRCITSNWDAKDKWQGILINDAVSQALKKTGDIYKFINSKHGVMLKFTCVSGPTADAYKASGLKRVYKIEW